MRRPAYLTTDGFNQVQKLLPVDPAGDNRPTVGEFLQQDLAPALARMAEEFDDLPDVELSDGRPGRLYHSTTAVTVEWFHLGARLDERGTIAVSLIGIWFRGEDDANPFDF